MSGWVRIGRRWATATALAVLGCSLLLGGGAGLSYAAYAVASKQLLDAHRPVAVMAVVFCLGPLLLGADLAWLADPRGLAVILHLGLIATALAYVLFARGLRRVPVSAAATYSLAEEEGAEEGRGERLGERLSPPRWPAPPSSCWGCSSWPSPFHRQASGQMSRR